MHSLKPCLVSIVKQYQSSRRSQRHACAQRLSVAITDAVFLSGTWLITKSQSGSHKGAIRILVAANVGLLLVDHIHFQYNGLLIGELFGACNLRVQAFAKPHSASISIEILHTPTCTVRGRKKRVCMA